MPAEQVSVRALRWVCRWLPSGCVLTWERGGGGEGAGGGEGEWEGREEERETPPHHGTPHALISHQLTSQGPID